MYARHVCDMLCDVCGDEWSQDTERMGLLLREEMGIGNSDDTMLLLHVLFLHLIISEPCRNHMSSGSYDDVVGPT